MRPRIITVHAPALAGALALAASCGSQPPAPLGPAAAGHGAPDGAAPPEIRAADAADRHEAPAAARADRGEPEAIEVVRLPAPPMTETTATDPAGRPELAAELAQRRVEKNAITDEDAWFAAIGLTVPEQPAPAGLPATRQRLDGLPLTRVIGGELLVYGDGEGGQVVLAGLGPEDQLDFAFDFASYRAPYQQAVAEPQLVNMELTWAARDGDVLYVSHAHRTYAKASGGKNAYVTALAVPSGELLWRSRPLVANARTFALAGDLLVTGYGFTAEDDFLYLLDARTGQVVDSAKLRSGPTYILSGGEDVFHVRAYDRNYEFEIERR